MADDRKKRIINLIGAGEYAPLVKTIGGVPQVSWQPNKQMAMTAPRYTTSRDSPYADLYSKYNITEAQAGGLQQLKTGLKKMKKGKKSGIKMFQEGVKEVSTPSPEMERNIQAGMQDIGGSISGAVKKKLEQSPPASYALAGEDITPAWARGAGETPYKKAQEQVAGLNQQEQERLTSMQNYVSSMSELASQLTAPKTAKAIAQSMVADFSVDALKEATAGTKINITDFVKSAAQSVAQTKAYLNDVSRTLKSVLDLEVDFNQLLMSTGMWRGETAWGGR